MYSHIHNHNVILKIIKSHFKWAFEMRKCDNGAKLKHVNCHQSPCMKTPEHLSSQL